MYISNSLLFSHRVQSEETISNSILESWIPPTTGSVMWDGKLMHHLETKYEDVERMPILVSGKTLTNYQKYTVCVF